jgi:hypothetical protein
MVHPLGIRIGWLASMASTSESTTENTDDDTDVTVDTDDDTDSTVDTDDDTDSTVDTDDDTEPATDVTMDTDDDTDSTVDTDDDTEPATDSTEDTDDDTGADVTTDTDDDLTWQTVFSKTLNSNRSGWGDNYFRLYLTTSDIAAVDGSMVRVTFTAPTNGSLVMRNAWIGDESGATDDFTGNQVRLTFGGNDGATVPSGGTIVSDPVPFAWDHTKRKMVHFSSSSATMRFVPSVVAGGTFNQTGDDDGSTTVTTANNEASWVAAVSKIEVG